MPHTVTATKINYFVSILDGKTPEKGSKYNSALEYILTLHLKHAKEPLNVIKNYVENGLNEIIKGEGNSNECEEYPTLNKNTLPTHYKCVFIIS